MTDYKANDTMKLIGKQDMAELAEIAPNMPDVVKDIVTAHGLPEKIAEDGNIIMLGADFILLGIVYGKRLERMRRKGAAK